MAGTDAQPMTRSATRSGNRSVRVIARIDSTSLSALDGIASVDRDGRARDEVGGRAREEDRDPGHVLLDTPTLGRGAPEHVVMEPRHLGARVAGELGVDPARQHRVDLDIVAGPARGHGPRQLDYSTLGGRVGRSEGGAEDGHHGPDIDDLAPTLLLHDRVA